MDRVGTSARPLHEVAIVTAIFAGWFIFASTQAMLTGFPVRLITDGQALGLVLFEIIAFSAAGAVLWVQGLRPRHFVFRIDWRRSFVGILLFGVSLLAHVAIWELIGARFGGRDFLLEFARATSLSLPVALLLSIVNGAFEEFFLTRYLLDAFAKYGPAIALGISALVRLVYHLYQGPLGALSVLAFGLIVTVSYWRFRELWPVMFAHMIADFVALV